MYSLFRRSSVKSTLIKKIESWKEKSGAGSSFHCGGVDKSWEWLSANVEEVVSLQQESW